MKKTLLFALGIMAIGATSCTKFENENSSTLTFPSYNLITNLDNGESYITNNLYSVWIDWTTYAGNVSTDNLIINNTNWVLNTEETQLYGAGGMILLMPKGNFSGNSSLSLKNPQFIIAPVVNYGNYGIYVNTTYVPGYSYPSAGSTYLISNYSIGDEYLVRTFLTDECFYGTTTTSYKSADGSTQNNLNENISYRIILQVDKKTATMIIYNAKFSASEREPVKTAIIVPDLDLSFGADGITITGKDIVPLVVEGSSTTPNENFAFNEITLKTVNDAMSSVNISFRVANIYNGNFTGSYFFEPKLQ